MESDVVLKTPRLLLRCWRDSDLEPFAAINADKKIMELLGAPLTRSESDRLAEKICGHFEQHGFGLWAVELPGIAPFVGCVGLSHVHFEAHFTPAVEIGWRIAFAHWGNGYASEAASAAVRYGFETLHLPEIVAFTVPANVASLRIMEKSGFHRDPGGDFDHPRAAAGHLLRRHVLYRLHADEWNRSLKA